MTEGPAGVLLLAQLDQCVPEGAIGGSLVLLEFDVDLQLGDRALVISGAEELLGQHVASQSILRILFNHLPESFDSFCTHSPISRR